MAKNPVRINPTDITEIRKLLKWDQRRLADYLGVSRETVSRRESGVIEISRETELAMRFLLVAELGRYDFPWRQK